MTSWPSGLTTGWTPGTLTETRSNEGADQVLPPSVVDWMPIDAIPGCAKFVYAT